MPILQSLVWSNRRSNTRSIYTNDYTTADVPI